MAAKTSDWRPGPTVCRCCFADGCYKDISTEYFWMGKREVYSEMLSDTFDVSIAYAQTSGPNSNSRLICEPCISRLRDASDFKRQVQECEKVFLQHLAEPGSSMEYEILPETSQKEEVKLERVKIEAKLDDDDDDFDDQLGFDDDDDDDMDDEPLTKFASKIPKAESDDLINILQLGDDTKKPEKRKSSTKVKLTTVKKGKKKESPKPSASKAASKPVVEKKKKGVLVQGQGSPNQHLVIKQEVDYDQEADPLHRQTSQELLIVNQKKKMAKLFLDKKGIEWKPNRKKSFLFLNKPSPHKDVPLDDKKSVEIEIPITKSIIPRKDVALDGKESIEIEIPITESIIPRKDVALDGKGSIEIEIPITESIISHKEIEIPITKSVISHVDKKSVEIKRPNTKSIIVITGKEESASKPNKISIKCKKLISTDANYNANRTYANFILENSNAIPFKYSRGKYMCMYCNTMCPDIEKLRIHSNTHDKLTSSLKKRLMFPLALEITGLTCNICNSEVYSLDRLKTHLDLNHSKKSPSEEDEGESVVPYIITENYFKCVHCDESFMTFGSLLLHSNKHYQNHVCDICGKGFPSQRRVKQHRMMHEEENRGCPKCDKVLPTKAARAQHMVYVHGKKDRYKCPICDATFNSYYARTMHLSSEHGQSTEYRCKECSEVFLSASLRCNHYRRIHLKIKDIKKKKQKNPVS